MILFLMLKLFSMFLSSWVLCFRVFGDSVELWLVDFGLVSNLVEGRMKLLLLCGVGVGVCIVVCIVVGWGVLVVG